MCAPGFGRYGAPIANAASRSAASRTNAKLGADVLADGRVYVGTTRYRGRVAFRPAIVNWRTTAADIDLLVEVVRELGARLGLTVASAAR